MVTHDDASITSCSFISSMGVKLIDKHRRLVEMFLNHAHAKCNPTHNRNILNKIEECFSIVDPS